MGPRGIQYAGARGGPRCPLGLWGGLDGLAGWIAGYWPTGLLGIGSE